MYLLYQSRLNNASIVRYLERQETLIMSKASQDLERAIANAAKVGTCLPQNIPEWMQKMGILQEDEITESTKF